jgi:microcystin-dependent protein
MKRINIKKPSLVITASCLLGLVMLAPFSVMAQEQFIGEVRMFAGNFAPRNWAFCNGQLLQIAQYSALFSILGTTYGGDGRVTFGLPDLRGRFPIHAGTGPGLTTRYLGQKSGEETVSLTSQQMPSHTHEAIVHAFSSEGDSSSPTGNIMAKSSMGYPDYSMSNPDTTLKSNTVEVLSSGGSQPHNNMPPFQTVNFIIALQGIYPSRN